MTRNNLFYHIWGYLLIATSLSVGCKDNHSILSQLSDCDRLIQTNPAAALDSLALFSIASLKDGREKAYYELLYTIAQHKNSIPFTSDSLIAESRKWYENRKDDYHNQARAFFYNGLVLHIVSNDEATACQFMRQALQIIDNHNIQDDKLTALISAYLGKINGGHAQNLTEAVNYLRRAIETEQRLDNPKNLIYDLSDLLICLVKMGEKKEARNTRNKLDSVVNSNLSIKIESSNNAKAIYFLHTEHNLDSALYYCKQWKPNVKDIGAKENIIASIYAQQGRVDSAIVYEKASFEHLRAKDSSSQHIYYKHLADYYSRLGIADSSAFYARLAYGALHDSFERKTEKRVLELEKQYDLTAKEAELEKVQYQQRLLVMGLVALVLLAGGLVLLLRNRSRELRTEKITRSFVQAAAKTHQNTLSLLKPLTTRPKSSTVEGLQASIAGIATDLRKGFTKNFSEAVEENKGALTSRQLKNLEKLNGERAKTIFILSELGYNEQEIAEYTCTSTDSVRTMINNNKKITDSRSSRE